MATSPVSREPTRRTETISVRAEIAAAVALWAVSVAAVALIRLEAPSVRQAALFVHLVSLAVGFGGVVTVDLHGLLWLLGRRTAADFLAMATATHGLIAAGLAGLLASGAVLRPDLGATQARLKLLLVLVIMLNGVSARRYAQRLRAVPGHIGGDAIPWEYLPRAFAIAGISQLAWWGAIVIGFLTSLSRS